MELSVKTRANSQLALALKSEIVWKRKPFEIVRQTKPPKITSISQVFSFIFSSLFCSFGIMLFFCMKKGTRASESSHKSSCIVALQESVGCWEKICLNIDPIITS